VVLGRSRLLAARSLDDGQAWLPPVQIGSQDVASFHDPGSSIELPQRDLHGVCAAREGRAKRHHVGPNQPGLIGATTAAVFPRADTNQR
jgi:hypothetical protein